MNIVFFYTNLTSNLISNIQRFIITYGGDFYVVREFIDQYASMRIESSSRLKIFNLQQYSSNKLLALCKDIKPDAIYVAGWRNLKYLRVARYFNSIGIPIICGMDNQWFGSLRQRIMVLFSRIMLHQIFNYIWIPGKPQYLYARKLGFKENNILWNLLTADLGLFFTIYKEQIEDRNKRFPKIFLFAGRLVKEKGLIPFLQEFQRYKDNILSDWELWIVGDGPEKDKIKTFEFVKLFDFVQPKELAELMMKAGIFIIPSVKEAWGLVIHEAAALGMPIIASKFCGAADTFIIEGENGYKFNPLEQGSLEKSIRKIINKSDSELIQMGKRSHKLANKITPDAWSSVLYNVVKQSKQK